ncbi:MAG: helix-turn-helix transcriptional regulator [Owenweeksia sp.]
MTTKFLSQIRKIRAKKGYSQEAISFDLGISQNAYSKIECGRSSLRLETLLKLSQALNLKVIMDKNSITVLENENLEAPVSPVKLKKEIHKIQHQISKLTDVGRLPTN